MSYISLVVGCERPLNIDDEEDLFVYLTSTDKENRRCLLVVESSGRSELVDKLSIVGKSSVGMNYEPCMNYEPLEPLEDEIGPNAITLYVEEKHGNNEGENDDDKRGDDYMETDTGMETNTGLENDVRSFQGS